MTLKDLARIPRQAVYAFINEAEKSIYINTSKNTLRAVSGHVDAFKDGCHPLPALQEAYSRDLLELQIIEEVHNPDELRYRLNYYIDYYTNMEYTIYNKVTIRSAIKIHHHYSGISVLVVNSRADKILLAKFNRLEIAEEFVRKNYPDGKVYRLIYG